MGTRLTLTIYGPQVEILQDGVDVHGKICAESVKPLHNHLASQHDKMRQETNKYRRELVSG